MSYPWQALDPKDSITIELSQRASPRDVDVLTLLYKPIIKANAYALYMTFQSYYDFSSRNQVEVLQSRLLAELDLGLADYYHARIKLEAMGLLNVYRSSGQNYIYTVNPPLSAKAFFNEPMLRVLLKDTVGDRLFNSYQDQLLRPLASKSGYQDITKSFLDVFQVNSKKISLDQQKGSEETAESKKLNLSQVDTDSFDWDLLEQGLSRQLVAENFLTEDLKELISVYHLAYGFDELEIRQAVLEAADLETGEVAVDKLQKILNRQVNRLGKVNQLTAQAIFEQNDLTDQKKHQNGNEEVTSADDLSKQIIDVAKSMSPYDYLESIKYQRNGIVSSSEKWLIKELIEYAKFPKEVLNILIHYILVVQNNTQMNKNFALRIADDWAQKHVTTAEEAFKVVRDVYMDNINRRQKKQSAQSAKRKYSKQGKVESRPEWMDQPAVESEPSKPEIESGMRDRLQNLMNREGE